MPGGSFCCVVGCSTSSEKCRGLSFHQLPRKGVSSGSGSEKDAWRALLMNAISRCDASFDPEKAKICSRHFLEDCFITKPSGRRQLKPGSMPTENMPRKSVVTPKLPPRKAPIDRSVRSFNQDNDGVTPVNQSSQLTPCPGITDLHLQMHAKLPTSGDDDYPPYYLHVIYERHNDLTTCTSTIRSQGCKLLHQSSDSDLCKPCCDAKRLVLKKEMHRVVVEKQNLRKYSPLSRVSKTRVENALKLVRVENRKAKKEIEDIRNKIKQECVEVSNVTHVKLQSIVNSVQMKNDSFIQKFWDEQQKAFQAKSGGMRWHPQMVRFAILLHSQSPSAYRALKEVGVLKLPSESTLRDYTNVLHPSSGFQMHVFQELANMTKDLSENERWVCLLHDEISIKSGLVYDRRSGELVGCVPESEWTAVGDHLATHALVFMVVGITSNIKMSLGYFPTKTSTADQIFPLLWKAVGLLECVCNLKVIASTSDKASPNQRLINIHGKGVFKAVNLFAPERFLYFISDVPHLIKTVRNNLASSGWGKNTRRLWNNGSEMLWSHVKNVYDEDIARELKRTKLTADHIYLSPQSVMRVYLAAQVLSQTVGRVLQTFHGPECQETANFILLMDKFFDCLNSRSTSEGIRKNNPYLLPYKKVDDERFQFLRDLLDYLEKWRASVFSRDGFSKAEKQKMFLSHQTYDGLKTTVNSVTEATQFLLNSGVSMVLTNRFCQDPLEEHFGRHRCMGIRAENPTLWTYGYQENKLRVQRSLALSILPKGNIRGKRKNNIVEVDNSPLPKIRRERKK